MAKTKQDHEVQVTTTKQVQLTAKATDPRLALETTGLGARLRVMHHPAYQGSQAAILAFLYRVAAAVCDAGAADSMAGHALRSLPEVNVDGWWVMVDNDGRGAGHVRRALVDAASAVAGTRYEAVTS